MAVKRTKNGKWQVRWRDDAGRQRALSFTRKIDAENHLKAIHGDLQRGTYVSPDAGKVTVRDWAQQWLTGARNLGEGGRDTYQRDLDRYILPALGDLTLRQLHDGTAIDRFLTDELERLAPSTVHRQYRTIRRMLQVAVERKRLPSNPCDPIQPPKVEHREMRFLTADQVEALAAAISPQNPRYQAWVHMAAYCGLRWGEAIGLRRVNIDGARLTVCEQLVRRPNGTWRRDRPKTKAGVRTITMPAFLEVEMKDHLETWSLDGPDGLVFPNRAGRPLIASSFRGNLFQPALKRAKLDPKTRIHDLRHTAVALAIAAGAHPKAIQARMGHASISVTLDRYGHLFPEMDEQIAVRLDELRGDPQSSGSS